MRGEIGNDRRRLRKEDNSLLEIAIVRDGGGLPFTTARVQLRTASRDLQTEATLLRNTRRRETTAARGTLARENFLINSRRPARLG